MSDRGHVEGNVVGVVRERFRSDDLGEAESHIGRNYGKVDLAADRLVFAESAVGDHRFGLRRLDIEGGYSAACDLQAFLVVQAAGGYEWEVGGQRGDAAEPVIFEPGSLRCRVQDTHVTVVALSVDAFTETARTVYNDDDLVVTFDDNRATDAALVRAWSSAAALAFDAGAAIDNDLVRASLFRSLAVATLETFALRGDRRVRVLSAALQQKAYRYAVSFFEHNAARPITVDDAAGAAGVSSDALARAFRSHSPSGRTPAQHLAAVRLDAAHADIIGATIGGEEDIRTIASRWGMSERGLVRRHLEVYGTCPRDLLGL